MASSVLHSRGLNRRLSEVSSAAEIEELKALRYSPASGTKNSDERMAKLIKMSDRKNAVVNIPRIEIDLGESFLETLSREEEIFAIKDGRIYTLGFPVDREEETIEYRGTRFELRESESVRKLEEVFFQANNEGIERFKSSLVNKLAQEEREINNNLQIGGIACGEESRREELLKEIQRYSRSTIKSPVEQRRPIREDIDFGSIERVDFGGRPVFNEVLERLPGSKRANTIVGVFGNLYLLHSKKLQIKLDDISEFEDIGGYETLNETYLEAIKERIGERTAQAAGQIISKISEKKSEVEAIKNNPAESSVKLRRLADDKCIIYREIPEFIIKRREDYCLFSAAKIAAKLEFRKDEVKVNLPGFILDDKSYYHPFSMGSTEYGTKICHGSTDWESRRINQAWQKISDSSRRNLAYQAHAVMDKLEQVLTMGCRKDFTPGVAFNGFNISSIDSSRAMALSGRGVKIYDNSK